MKGGPNWEDQGMEGWIPLQGAGFPFICVGCTYRNQRMAGSLVGGWIALEGEQDPVARGRIPLWGGWIPRCVWDVHVHMQEVEEGLDPLAGQLGGLDRGQLGLGRAVSL